MPSVTSWTRLEPRTRSEQLPGLEARIADPLWLLGRQWQMGEVQGEDAGSPVSAQLSYAVSPLTRYAPGLPGGNGSRALPGGVPLEALVEAEPPDAPAESGDLRAGLEAGQRLLDLLGAQAARFAGPLADAFGPEPAGAGGVRPDVEAADVEAARLRALAAGRLADGRRLWPELHAWRAGGGSPPTALAGADAATAAAADTWLAWYESRQAPAGGTPESWRAQSLDYAFSLAARAGTDPGETVLVADGFRGGELDWTAVDVWAGASIGAAADSAPGTESASPLPTRVTFPGMPVARWWQIEEGDVDLSALQPGPEDIGRLLLTEFVLNYGNDFFWIPVDLPVGSVTTVTGLNVRTSFGDTVDVPTTAAADHAARRDPGFAMFQHTVIDHGVATGASDALVLLPAGPLPLHGEPVEHVHLSRDEQANLAWALELAVPGPSGRPVSRHEAWQRSRPDPEPQPGEPHAPALIYHPATALPPYWLPLLPRPGGAAAGRSLLLTLGGPSPPAGTVLTPGFTLHEERLAKSGIRLCRRAKRVRWTDGSTHLWITRETGPGSGGAGGGLRFDDIRGE